MTTAAMVTVCSDIVNDMCGESFVTALMMKCRTYSGSQEWKAQITACYRGEMCSSQSHLKVSENEMMK